MKTTDCYLPSQTMRSLIEDNPSLLMAMSRFGISLGICDKTVSEVCERHGVDCDTFLAVSNFISHGMVVTSGVSVPSLMMYLKRAHTYFLDYCLPMIRRRLIDAIDCAADEVGIMIVKFYDAYVAEVTRHMGYENDRVFGYVERLLEGVKDSEGYNIAVFASGHHGIDSSLTELQEIIISYLPQRENNRLNSVLFDIINCREDLKAHCAVEDRLFVPAVADLERRVDSEIRRKQSGGEPTETSGCESNELSQREREIIAFVAKGLSNTEIADRLCISVNTVTTHRRNIASKLQIHSPAALAIYAVINGIITLEHPQK